MADIELVIKIPKEAKQAFNRAESNDLKGGYYDHGGVIGKAIKNGTPLPKGHGRLIDADKIPKGHGRLIDADKIEFEYYYGEWFVTEAAIDHQPTILEADTESEGK